MKISDSRLAGVLAAILDGSTQTSIVPRAEEHKYDVDIKIEVQDNHRRDCPDAVLTLTVTLRHPLLPVLTARIPIPIEGEVAGIGAAKLDLQKFADRGRFPLHIPMLVIGGPGGLGRASAEVSLKTKVAIDMIPYRHITNA